jgi:LEA14-like dessication related protein
MRNVGIILCIIAVICIAGCLIPQYQEPTVTVDGIAIENITLSSIDLQVRLTITNPNPVGATLQQVSFDVYFLAGGEQMFLAHGERGGFNVRPEGDTTISIPVTVDNVRLVQVVISLLQEGAVTFRVSGSGTFDVGGVTTFEVPFNETTEVRLPSR